MVVYEEAIGNLGICLSERLSRLKSFLREHTGQALPELAGVAGPACPLSIDGDSETEHTKWIQALPDSEVERGRVWLQSVARAVRERLTGTAG